MPGGQSNTAQGARGFAAGNYAKAYHGESFVWGSGSTFIDTAVTPNVRTTAKSTANNEVTFKADGGFRIITAINTTTGVPTAGSYITAGGGGWNNYSDRNVKENIVKVDGRDVLARIAKMDISSWNYKSQDDSIRHIGPMAQDFYSVYGLGTSDKHINTIDIDGVALAAIQGLYDVVKDVVREKEEKIARLEARLAKLESKLN